MPVNSSELQADFKELAQVQLRISVGLSVLVLVCSQGQGTAVLKSRPAPPRNLYPWTAIDLLMGTGNHPCESQMRTLLQVH